jgi:DNA-binding transcriptional LysR family regulator
MRRLPSLNGLRAFESAARHGSFTAAADELNVTQAAVSRMVRLLEQRMGIQLFERRPNGLALTMRGKALQPGLSAAFDAIAGACEQIVAMRGSPVLTLGVGPSFAVRWLIPRLASFHQEHSEIEVRIATGGAINPYQDDWTCGIRLGDGDWPGYEAEPLFSADLFPVCAPNIAKRLQGPADLRQETLLQVAHSPGDWPLWLSAAEVRIERNRLGPRFDNYAMALQAALDGVGVAIGLRPYVADDLVAGRLIAPFPLTVPKGQAWYLVYQNFRQEEPGFLAFRAWLRRKFSEIPP